jgi:hypothetical protein
MVHGFEQDFALEDTIGSHACSLEASMNVTNIIPLGCPPPLTVLLSIYDVTTQKASFNKERQKARVSLKPPCNGKTAAGFFNKKLVQNRTVMVSALLPYHSLRALLLALDTKS